MKKTILLVFTLATTVLAFAQSKQEISVYLGAGPSSLKYDLGSSGETSSKFGPLLGVGYTYKLNSQWGIVSGLEMATYKTDVTASTLKNQYMTKDNYGNDFEWRLSLNNLEENQKGTYINIPLMAQFTPGNNGKFYTNFGFKVGLPMSGKYEAKYTKLVTSGYYPETGAEYTDINFRGFGEFGGSSQKGDIDFGVAFILAVECGLKWSLSNSMNLYAGGYVDYGLNNIVKDSGKSELIPYNNDNPTNFGYNSLMQSVQLDGSTTKPFVDKVVPFALGLKVRLGFSL